MNFLDSFKTEIRFVLFWLKVLLCKLMKKHKMTTWWLDNRLDDKEYFYFNECPNCHLIDTKNPTTQKSDP